MEYDLKSRTGQIPMYHRPPPSSSPSPMYPKVGPHGQSGVPPYQQNSTPSPATGGGGGGGGGLGIRVAIKPEYRITPPPHLLPHASDIPRSNFHFDFGLERKILAESHKDNPNWTKFGLDNLPTKLSDSTSSKVSASDPIVSKYFSMGLSREAVPIAVANYGDNPTKVQEFVNGYTLLREMGFSSSSVAEALVMNDNDTDKSLAHFLNSSS